MVIDILPICSKTKQQLIDWAYFLFYLQNTHICLVNIQQTLWQRESRSALLRDFPQFPLGGCQLSLGEWQLYLPVLPIWAWGLPTWLLEMANLDFEDCQLQIRDQLKVRVWSTCPSRFAHLFLRFKYYDLTAYDCFGSRGGLWSLFFSQGQFKNLISSVKPYSTVHLPFRDILK